MKTLISALLLLICCTVPARAVDTPRYAVAQTPTPVLNTPDFARVFGGSLKLDPCKGVRPIEFIALPGTLFRIEGEQRQGEATIYRVTSSDYPFPAANGYFIDARFVKSVSAGYPERARSVPPLELVQERLLAALGKPYVWGGNCKDGVPLLKRLYPGADPLAGVDCSGLLYEATDGSTPRNTTALTYYGKGVAIAGLSAQEIARKLEPLDLVAWKGHVMIVLDRERIIQSVMGCQGGSGVRISPLQETLHRLMKGRTPEDDYRKVAGKGKGFVVRRWFPHTAGHSAQQESLSRSLRNP